MTRTRIKFCGITRPQDAATAADAGADAIGIVFHPPAARCVSIERAAEIIATLPLFVTPVGLFVDQPREEILATANRLSLSAVQLHGDESPQFVADLPQLRIIKAIRVTRDRLPDELHLWRQAIANLRLTHLAAFVLETGNITQSGGSGIENDWDFVADCQQRGLFAGLPPIILAGGLRPENVGAVVRRLRPYAVDVSSGVELSKGIKSADKLVHFATEVRSANAS